MILYKKDEFIYYDFGTGNPSDKAYGNDLKVNFFDHGSNVIQIVIDIKTGHDFEHIITRLVPATEIQDRLGVAYGSTLEEVIFGFNKGTDVNQQDQTTDAIIAHFNQVSNSTILVVAAEIGEGLNYTITVDDDTGVIAGSMIILFHPASERFSNFHALSATDDVITLDRPIDFDYPIGTFVDIASNEMAVDGSSTPQVFGLRGTGAPPGVDIAFDMTRIIFKCKTATAVDLAKFGDLDALINGLVFRTRNNRFHNIFNIKSNGELAGIMYDWTPYAADNPVQGQNGFVARLTFAGMDKMGVAIRLPIGTDAEFVIQDDLVSAQSGSRQITSLIVTAEGHIVEP
ncbi:MAG: hypothetical protein V3V72_13575 [Ignavibacteriaceae bacterium]